MGADRKEYYMNLKGKSRFGGSRRGLWAKIYRRKYRKLFSHELNENIKVL